MRAHFVKFKTWYGSHKKITIPLTLLLLGGIGAILWFTVLHDSAAIQRISNQTSERVEELQPTTVASPLTGVQVDAKLAKRPVLGVMVENSSDARPQSGLDKAGVVFEAIAEGGITRFLALYQEESAKQIGPVRSVRPYYVDWADGFNASLVHVGGSAEGLKRATNVLGARRNLDEFRFGARLVPRVSFRARPHNAYTSSARMRAIAKETGHTTSEFTSLARKDPAPAEAPDTTKISVNFSSPFFQVGWRYDRKNNTYVRSNGGTRQLDRETKKALRAEVVVVMKASYRTASSVGHQKIATTGKGTVYVFQDGTVTRGVWRKTSTRAQLTFTDTHGDEILLNRGRTWFEVIPTDKTVTYN
jgi:hypothetical protein